MLANPIASDRSSRWALASRLIEDWFGDASQPKEGGFAPTDLGEAERRLGLTLPASLREWYLHSGARGDVWSVQDRLVPPRELCVEEDRLIIFRENQNVVQWGIQTSSLREVDPPVVVFDPSGAGLHHVEALSVSAFALQMLVLNAKFSGLDLSCANG